MYYADLLDLGAAIARDRGEAGEKTRRGRATTASRRDDLAHLLRRARPTRTSRGTEDPRTRNRVLDCRRDGRSAIQPPKDVKNQQLPRRTSNNPKEPS